MANDNFDDLNFDDMDDMQDDDWLSSDSFGDDQQDDMFEEQLNRVGGQGQGQQGMAADQGNFGGFQDPQMQQGQPNQAAQVGQQKSDTIKAAVAIIVLGIVIVLIAQIAYRFLQGKNQEDLDSLSNNQTQQIQQEQQGNAVDNESLSIGTSGKDSYKNPGNSQNTQNGQTVPNSQANDKWIEFTDEDANIIFNDEYTTAQFTITGVKHYVSIQDSDQDYMETKQVLYGQIQGLPGVYEISIPYQMGVKTKVGKTFDIQVLYGEYNGRTVVGDIRYY